MRFFHSFRFPFIFLGLLVLAGLSVPRTAQAQQNWGATVGAQSNDMARQVLAFLPNEIWIHAGDSITWTVATGEIHTITFLTAGQPRPPFQNGCPGFTLGIATFDGSICVSSPPLVKGQTFTVRFPTAGNYKLACLVHGAMTGAIHVLNASENLPHDQAFYDVQAADEQRDLLTDVDHVESMDDMHDMAASHASSSISVRILSTRNRFPVTAKEMPAGGVSDSNQVTAGVGEIVATPGGPQTLSVVRFLGATTTIHAGDIIEWSNSDPVTPHTITFGPEPANLMAPSGNITVDADGARHAIITSPSDVVHSGFIVAAPQERVGLAQAPLSVTRFRITFTQPGTYNYKCALHDNLGMVGKVIVVP